MGSGEWNSLEFGFWFSESFVEASIFSSVSFGTSSPSGVLESDHRIGDFDSSRSSSTSEAPDRCIIGIDVDLIPLTLHAAYCYCR